MTRVLPSSSEEAGRLRRVRAVLLESPPSDKEILARLRRHRERRANLSRKPKAALVWALLLGVPLSGTLAWAVQSPQVEAWLADSTADPASVHSSRHTRNHAVQLPAQQDRSTAPSNSSATATPPDNTRPSTAAPRSNAATPSATPVPSKTARKAKGKLDTTPLPKSASPLWQEPSVAATPTAAEPSPSSSAATVTASPGPGGSDADHVWVQVAALMQAGRYQEAQQALAPLLRTGDLRARQAATLLGFQLRLVNTSRSLTEGERQQLEQLATSGLSPSIRRSARRLLNQVQ